MASLTNKVSTEAKLLSAAHYAATKRSASTNTSIVSDAASSWLAAMSRKAATDPYAEKAQRRLSALVADCVDGDFEYVPLSQRRHIVVSRRLDVSGDRKEVFARSFPRLVSCSLDVIDTMLTGAVPSQLVGGRHLVVPVYAFDQGGYGSWMVVVTGSIHGERSPDTRDMNLEEFFTMASAFDDVGKMFTDKKPEAEVKKAGSDSFTVAVKTGLQPA